MISAPVSDEALRLAAEFIISGEVAAYPTETLYALGADATSDRAVERLFAIKKRPPNKPSPVIVADMDMARELAEDIPPRAIKLINRFWPGPLTIIFNARPDVPKALTAGTGTVGIRVSSGEVALRLVRITGKPLTATSANKSGAGDASDPAVIGKELGQELSIIIDAGKLDIGPGSTIVDPRGETLVILREGVIPAETILAVWNEC